MTKAEEIFKNMREEMPWRIIGEEQLKPYILEAMQVYGKYCADQAWNDALNEVDALMQKACWDLTLVEDIKKLKK